MVDRLIELATQLTDDERSVLVAMAEGILAGRAQYGTLNPHDPARDWLQECWEEMRDASNYVGAQLVRLGRLKARREELVDCTPPIRELRVDYPYGAK